MDARPIPPDKDARTEIDHPSLSQLYDYWDRKRGERRAPGRQDIDPVDIPRILPHLLMCEVVSDPRDYLVTLFGTALVEIFGADLTNESFNSICASPFTSGIRKEYDQVTESFTPIFGARDARWMGREHVRYSRLLLPLSDDDQTVNKLFGAVYLDRT
ncbi:MAG: PAS domain-containing protein [Alphaproteobacteria bacterium]|nr:PAS domain-containing protein [Alphaproteobacteria bacterium]